MKFKDVVEIRNGRNQHQVENPNGAYPIYGSGGEIGRADDYICEAGTVVIGRKGSINNPLFVDEPFWNVDTAFGLVANKEVLLPKYLFYFCKAFDFESLNTTVTIPSLTKSNLQEIEIKLPSVASQQNIVKLLDGIWNLIELQRLQLCKLDEVVKSRFIEMFGDPGQNPHGWTLKPLLKMGYCKNGLNFRPGESGVEIHCLGVGDFKDLSIINDTEMLPTILLNETPPKESLLKDGDIVFVRSNGNKALVGRCLAVFPHSTPTTYSGFCIRYRLTSSEIIPLFLLNVLKTDFMREMVKGRGANIQNLNQQILASLQIPIPPLDLQKAYVEFVEQVDKSKYGMLKRIKSAMIELVHSQKLVFVTS